MAPADNQAQEPAVTLEYRGTVGIITLNVPKKLNALSLDDYYRISQYLREIAKRDDIFVTVITGKGRFFSAGADVKIPRASEPGTDVYLQSLTNFVAKVLNTTQAFYSHPKILVAALNGPAIGISASFIAHADFIYAAPHTYLLTPFSSLGLVAEGGASMAFVQRLGIAKANEALIQSKRITCEELVQTGFVNKVFNTQQNDSDKFLGLVLDEIHERMGPHLNQSSMVEIKALIKKPLMAQYDAQAVAEGLNGLQRQAAGIPQEEFRKFAAGEKRHKL